MRLKDADELIEVMKNDDAFDSYELEMILENIENAPIAYDIDKVVEELELHSFEMGTDTLPAHYVRLNRAIEIVKEVR